MLSGSLVRPILLWAGRWASPHQRPTGSWEHPAGELEPRSWFLGHAAPGRAQAASAPPTPDASSYLLESGIRCALSTGGSQAPRRQPSAGPRGRHAGTGRGSLLTPQLAAMQHRREEKANTAGLSEVFVVQMLCWD